MTPQELALKPAAQVRKDAELMRLYMQYYKGVFNSEPVCAGCSFSRDWKKFKNRVLKNNINQTFTTMASEEKNFELKNAYKNRILTYREGKKPFRRFGRDIDNDFVQAFLTNGTQQQIKERKQMFKTLPDLETQQTARTQSQLEAQKQQEREEREGNTAEQTPEDSQRQEIAQEQTKVAQQTQQTQTQQKKGDDLEAKACRVQDLNLDQLEKEVAQIEDVNLLNRVVELENEKDQRKGAFEILDERLAELKQNK